MNSGRFAYIILTLLLALLFGCGTGYAPVTDQSLGARQPGTVASTQAQSRPAPLPNPGSYRVNRGDTLYSISWRYGLDYREVARWNNINERFQIFPGQVLRLSQAPVASSSTVTAPPVSSASTSITHPTVPQSSQSSTPSAADQSPVNQRSVTHQTVTQQPITQQPVASTPPTAQPQPVLSGQPAWRWPSDGTIIRRFSAQEGGNKGIDIAGPMGSPVLAAADGRVVYAGSGLLGYGNLVIVNHNREFLSAYAHNSRILVSENDMVKVGQKIAEMGQTGADRVQLHFEIRRNGKPVDPMIYLPKR